MKYCKDCYHFKKDKFPFIEMGWCRRYPPNIIENISPNYLGIFPRLNHNNTCGEYKYKDLR